MKLQLDSIRLHDGKRARLVVKLGQDGAGTVAVKPYGKPTAYTVELEAVAEYIRHAGRVEEP